MQRLYLTLMIGGFLNSSIMANLQAPTLNSSHSVVSPGESLHFRCITSNTTYTNAKFTLYRNDAAINIPGGKFTMAANASSRGLYTCDYIFKNSQSSKSNVINITVVSLQQPDISFMADKAWLLWGSDELQVVKGYNFSITCSTKPQYPGGSFNLKFNGSNTSKSNSNHSGIFYFPEADFNHQGNYSCTYEVNVSSRTFTSNASEILQITVKAFPVLYIGAGGTAGLLLLLIPVIICFVKRRKRQKRRVNISKTFTQQLQNFLGPEDAYEVPQADEETEDEADYENAKDVFPEQDDSGNDSENDYVNVEVCASAVNNNYEDEAVYANCLE